MNPILVVCTVLVAGSAAQFVVSSPWGVSPWGVSPLSLGSPVISPYLADPRVIVKSVVQPHVVVSPVSLSTSSQYHAQDELGQFAFGHRSDTQARDEVKSADGTVRGAYSYVDATGKLIHVQYLADSNGFRVLGANNLPVAPEVTLEPVKDTPEVIAARAEFARKFEEAKEAASKVPEEKSRRRRDLVAVKSVLKLKELSPVEGALTPANTKLTEIKDIEKEIITPYSIPTLLTHPLIHTPVYPSVIVKSDIKPIDEKIILHDSIIGSPLLTSRIFSPSLVSVLGKTTIKTSELNEVKDAKTPAATKLAEIKETEKDILTPFSWQVPTLIHSPVVTSRFLPYW